MNNKNEEKIKADFEITGALNRTVLDGLSNPVDGIVISFTTKKGVIGSLEMPMKSYTKENALKLIAKKTEKLEELLP